MDKLRAIQYFVAAAETGSFAGAARRHEVSVPAVHKLVVALEHSLGASLLERHAQGVRLTPGGTDYLDSCRAVLEELGAAEDLMRHAQLRPSGTLAVAAHEQLVHHVLLPALPLFRARYPDLQFDLRTVHRLGDADAQSAEILLLHGWPEATGDHVHRKLDMTRSLVMATPGYWGRCGVPDDPAELTRHDCLTMRNPAGIVIDVWEFARGEERRAVTVRGWLSSNARELVLAAVLRGEGVGRFNEVTTRQAVRSGQLVPVLRDWEVQGGPPINLLYRASARHSPRARLFIDFIHQVLAQHEAEGAFLAQHPSAELPAWHRRGYGRASAVLRKAGAH